METTLTSKEELRQLITDGDIFPFCVSFALNLGFKSAIKEQKKVSFTVGDYKVDFLTSPIHFQLTHQIYFARIILAFYGSVEFIGDNFQEVIADLLTEFDKETNGKLL